MRVIGYPTEFKKEEGLQPIDIQDIQIQASIDELVELSTFLNECIHKFKGGQLESRSIELGDSKPNPQTGIYFLIEAVDK